MRRRAAFAPLDFKGIFASPASGIHPTCTQTSGHMRLGSAVLGPQISWILRVP